MGSTAFGHGGAGKSIGFADPEHGYALALTTIRLANTVPAMALLTEQSKKSTKHVEYVDEVPGVVIRELPHPPAGGLSQRGEAKVRGLSQEGEAD